MKRKRIFIGLVGVIIVAGAAYLAMRLINPDAAAIALGLNPGGIGPATNSFSIELEPADELPNREAEVTGPVSAQSGHVLTIQAIQGGQMMRSVTGSDQGSQGENNDGEDEKGIPTEVVVNQDTIIYQDVTMDGVDLGESSSMKLKQLLEPATINDIQDGVSIQVWGDKRGDRYIAEIIVITQPVTISGNTSR